MQKILFILILSFPFYNLFSQENASTSGEASVNLIVPLSIRAGAGDLDFGEIILTGLPIVESIEPRSGKKFIVKGQQGRTVTIMFSDVKLNNSHWIKNIKSKYGELYFSPIVITSNGVKIKSGNSIFLVSDGLVGKVKLFVGGTININANQPIGDYVGLFAISVAY